MIEQIEAKDFNIGDVIAYSPFTDVEIEHMVEVDEGRGIHFHGRITRCLHEPGRVGSLKEWIVSAIALRDRLIENDAPTHKKLWARDLKPGMVLQYNTSVRWEIHEVEQEYSALYDSTITKIRFTVQENGKSGSWHFAYTTPVLIVL